MRHHIKGMLNIVTWNVSLGLRFSDPNNFSVLLGSASPGPRLSTDPQLFHISLNLAVLWWSSRYAGLIDFGGPQGRHTMQFWGGNLRSYQRDLQYCHYHWFHKCGHRLLPTLRHYKPWFCHFCSKSKNSNVVCNFDVWYIFWFIWPYFRQFTPTLRSSTKGGSGSSNSSNSGNETVPYLAW